MYKINEIFYSIQGEGVNAGVPAVFVRFSGCNLSCPFCDTDHRDGRMMSAAEIVSEVCRHEASLVVLTGGEPSLYIDAAFIDLLHAASKTVAIETNGTHPLPEGIDHLTLSPKDAFCGKSKLVIDRCDELKVIFTGNIDPGRYDNIKATHRVLQPCDTGDPKQNEVLVRGALNYCMEHPRWRLSLQLHKLLNVR